MKAKKVKVQKILNFSRPDIISGVQGPTKVFRVFDIRYDTDGHRVAGLPKELVMQVDADIEPSIELGDYISDHTGWCHFGYNFEEIEMPVEAEVVNALN